MARDDCNLITLLATATDIDSESVDFVISGALMHSIGEERIDIDAVESKIILVDDLGLSLQQVLLTQVNVRVSLLNENQSIVSTPRQLNYQLYNTRFEGTCPSHSAVVQENLNTQVLINRSYARLAKRVVVGKLALTRGDTDRTYALKFDYKFPAKLRIFVKDLMRLNHLFGLSKFCVYQAARSLLGGLINRIRSLQSNPLQVAA